MHLYFTPTSGIKSLNAANNYINDLSLRASDLRPFLKGIEPDVIQSLKHEFDASNPNKWQQISKAWRELKLHEGKPENIGIYTGQLMKAVSDDAIRTYFPTGMKWKSAPVYSIDFTIKRRIGITTQEWIRGLGRRIVNVILGRAQNG